MSDIALLTPAQQKVLDAVLVLTKEKGWPPTFDEIGSHCGISSKSTIWDHLQALQAKGYIQRGPGSRAIRVIEQGENL